MRDRDGGRDPTPHPEPAGDPERSRGHRGHQVVANAVGHSLVERAFIAIAPQVQLEALELDAQLIGHVVDQDRCEIRLPGHRAQARELGALELDMVVAPRPGVCERLQLFARPRGHRRYIARCRSGPDAGVSQSFALQWLCDHVAENTRDDRLAITTSWTSKRAVAPITKARPREPLQFCWRAV